MILRSVELVRISHHSRGWIITGYGQRTNAGGKNAAHQARHRNRNAVNCNGSDVTWAIWIGNNEAAQQKFGIGLP